MFTRILFFFNDTATTEIYTLSLHDALPISGDHHVVGTCPAYLLQQIGHREGDGLTLIHHLNPDRVGRYSGDGVFVEVAPYLDVGLRVARLLVQPHERPLVPPGV